MRIYPVIMCGGAGTRLWPASTSTQPKQFHRLVTDKSIFQETVLRLQGVFGIEVHPCPVIVSNRAYGDTVLTQLEEIGISPLAVLLEPFARNTAAVAAIAAEFVREIDPDGLVLLLPSDHHISRPDAFHAALSLAAPVAAEGCIATFGILPDRPETGFGYIQAGEQIGDTLYQVAAFREKPDSDTANAFLKDLRFSWNAGIFLFSPDTMLAELRLLAPDILEPAVKALKDASHEGAVIRLDQDAFERIPPKSIDYAVMEHTRRAVVCAPVCCGWSDIGTWPVVGDLGARQPLTEPVRINADDCLVYTEDDTLVALVGVRDLVVAVVDGNVLVVPKSKAQDVGLIVEELKARGLQDRI